MKKITCHICLQPEAVLTVQGERSSQFACHSCGEVFETDHPPQHRATQARPQTFPLPSVAGVASISPARPSND